MLKVFKLIFAILPLTTLKILACSEVLSITIEWQAPRTKAGYHFYQGTELTGSYIVDYREYSEKEVKVILIPTTFARADGFNLNLYIHLDPLNLMLPKTDFPSSAGVVEKIVPPTLPSEHKYNEATFPPHYYITLSALKPGARVIISKAEDNTSLLHSVRYG